MRSSPILGFVLILSVGASACSTHVAATPSNPAVAQVAPRVLQNGQPPVNWEDFQVFNPSSFANGLAVGADGNIWFTICCNAWGFGKVTMTGSVTTFPVSQSNSPLALVRGPKSKLWFAELFNDIGSISTAGVITNYQIPIPNEQATSLTIGPDRNIWFSEQQPDGKQAMIGRMKPDGQFLPPFSVQGGRYMTTGPDGRVWIPQAGVNEITAVTAMGQSTTYGGLTEPAGQIVSGPDGNLWFVERDYVGKITTSGVVTEYSEPTSLSLASLTVGPDRHIWFTSGQSNWIGRISLLGQTQFFENPATFGVEGTIVKGPDNNLWFAETNYIGVLIRLVLTVQPSTITFTAVGQQQTIAVSEKHYSGTWTATSQNTLVATVAPVSSDTFTVTAAGSGSTSIDVADTTGNDFLVRVTVP